MSHSSRDPGRGPGQAHALGPAQGPAPARGQPLLAHVIAPRARSTRAALRRGRPWRRAGRARFADAERRWVDAGPAARHRPRRDAGGPLGSAFDPGGTVLVLNGDVPLIAAGDPRRASSRPRGGGRLALLTVELRRSHRLRPHRARRRRLACRIVEHKDASPSERAIREVYTGMMAAPTRASETLAGAARATTTRRASTT